MRMAPRAKLPMRLLGRAPETAAAQAVPLTAPGGTAVRLLSPPTKLLPQQPPLKSFTDSATPGQMPWAPRQPPVQPTAPQPLGSECTTRAAPSAPPRAPATVSVKEAFQLWCVGSTTGAHRAAAWLVAPEVRVTSPLAPRKGVATASLRAPMPHMLRSRAAPGRAQVAGVGGAAQGAPTVRATAGTLCVK